MAQHLDGPVDCARAARPDPDALGAETGALRVIPGSHRQPLNNQVRKTPSWPRSWANFSLL
jgi:hypothetical protein